MTRFISILILIFALVACTDGPVNTTQESANDLQVQTSSEFASSTSTSTSDIFYYVDWESANPSTGTASGTIRLGDGSTVDVTFEVFGEYGSPGTFLGAQTSGGDNFWVPNAPYISDDVPNAPPDSDIIQLSGGNNDRYTITFSESVKDPIMPVLSLGQAGNAITYNFDREFEVVSTGRGYYGDGPFFVKPESGNMVLVGEEGHGTIRFIGTFSTLSWTVPTPEVWHGITLGIRTTTAIEPDDETPPSIEVTVSGTQGNNGWYTSDVSVSWTVIDNESDISSSEGCEDSEVTEDTEGITFTCSATSAGGTASDSVTIKRDATNPLITFSGNENSYTVDQTVDISCSASDEMSGIANSDCPGASGDAYTFGLGTTTLNASATDNAGNGSTALTEFNVSVTSGSLCSLVREWVSQRGVANALCQQLNNGAIRGFQNTVRAQSGRHIPAEYASILLTLSDGL